MNLIAEVSRLKELEAKATGIYWDSIGESISTSEMIDIDGKEDRFIDIPYNENDAEFIAAMRNAAPALLDILGEIREGDADILQLFVEFMEKHVPDGHLSDTGRGAEITNAKATDCLRRYQAMAARMETVE